MARPEWTPTPEEKKLFDAAIEAIQAADVAMAQAWKVVAAARAGGVPLLPLSKKLGRSRATIYRHIGPDEHPAE